MNLKAWIPSPPELGREALIVLGGALIAAYLLYHWPTGRDYIRRAWQS